MIRNYYTEAFKGGILPIIGGTDADPNSLRLIDGTVKITESVAVAANPVNGATSVTITLAIANLAIKRGMYITAGTEWVINDHIMVEAVVHNIAANTTTITLNKPKALTVNAGLVFFNVNQNSWREYSLYIGTAPGQGNNFGSITSGTANTAAAAQNIITVKVSNPYVQVGMTVYDDGTEIGVVNAVTNSTTFVLAGALAAVVVADSILTFSFTVLPSISVLTIDNQTLTFTNPAQGFVLPVSVVQVTGVAGGLTNLIALN